MPSRLYCLPLYRVARSLAHQGLAVSHRLLLERMSSRPDCPVPLHHVRPGPQLLPVPSIRKSHYRRLRLWLEQPLPPQPGQLTLPRLIPLSPSPVGRGPEGR